MTAGVGPRELGRLFDGMERIRLDLFYEGEHDVSVWSLLAIWVGESDDPEAGAVMREALEARENKR